MNQSVPILICDENEDIRLLIKEMLIKHGFFHLLEVHSKDEVVQNFNPKQFILIRTNLIDGKIRKLLSQTSRFLIVAQHDKEETIKLAAAFGVDHLISFPYSSRSLVEKINSLMAY